MKRSAETSFQRHAWRIVPESSSSNMSGTRYYDCSNPDAYYRLRQFAAKAVKLQSITIGLRLVPVWVCFGLSDNLSNGVLEIVVVVPERPNRWNPNRKTQEKAFDDPESVKSVPRLKAPEMAAIKTSEVCVKYIKYALMCNPCENTQK